MTSHTSGWDMFIIVSMRMYYSTYMYMYMICTCQSWVSHKIQSAHSMYVCTCQSQDIQELVHTRSCTDMHDRKTDCEQWNKGGQNHPPPTFVHNCIHSVLHVGCACCITCTHFMTVMDQFYGVPRVPTNYMYMYMCMYNPLLRIKLLSHA